MDLKRMKPKSEHPEMSLPLKKKELFPGQTL